MSDTARGAMVDAEVDCERVAARRVAGSSPGKRRRVVCAGRHPAPLTGAETGRERCGAWRLLSEHDHRRIGIGDSDQDRKYGGWYSEAGNASDGLVSGICPIGTDERTEHQFMADSF